MNQARLCELKDLQKRSDAWGGFRMMCWPSYRCERGDSLWRLNTCSICDDSCMAGRKEYWRVVFSEWAFVPFESFDHVYVFPSEVKVIKIHADYKISEKVSP